MRPMVRAANPSAVLKVLKQWKGWKASSYVVEAPQGSCTVEFHCGRDRIRVLLKRVNDQNGRAHWIAPIDLNGGSALYADGFERSVDALLRDRRAAAFVSLHDHPPMPQ